MTIVFLGILKPPVTQRAYLPLGRIPERFDLARERFFFPEKRLELPVVRFAEFGERGPDFF